MGTGLPPPGVPRPLAEGEFVQSAPSNVVTFSIQGVEPPSPLYVQRDDVLAIYGESFRDAEILYITARMLPASPPVTGQPAPAAGPQAAPVSKPGSTPIGVIQAQLQMPTARTPYLIGIPLMEGYLLSVGVSATQAWGRSETFVRGFIQRNFPASEPIWNSLPLFSDSPSILHLIGWPWGRTLHPTEGPGYPLVIHPADMGGGIDLSISQAAQDRWRIQSIKADLVTSAAVATRTVRILVMDNAGNIFWKMAANATQAASLTYTYNFSSTSGATLTDPTMIYVPLPAGLVISRASALLTSTINLQGADQWKNIYIGVEAWLDYA